MRTTCRRALGVLLVPLVWSAQSAAALSLLDIIEMSRGGYSEEEMGRIIEVTGARFEIDGVALVALHEAEVPDAVVYRMLDEGGVPPTEVSEMSASEILELHEAGLSDETILKFVRHRNVCTPLSEDGVELLEREEFTPEFLEGFALLVAECERERVAREPVEPLPETAYAGSAPVAADDAHGTSQPVYHNTYHYDQHYYERPYHDHHFGGHYHPTYVYSYYHYDPLRRVYPIYIYRDHRDRGDRKRRGDRRRAGPPRDRGRREAVRRPAVPGTAPGAVPARVPGSVPGEGSRLFDEPRPVMSARPGGGGGGSRPDGKAAPRPRSEPVVPGRPLLRGTPVTNGVAGRPADTPDPATGDTPPAKPRLPASIPGIRPAPGARAGIPVRPQGRPTGGVVVPDVARPDSPPSTRPARATASGPRSGGQRPAVPAVPRTAREAIPVRRRVVAPDRATPRPAPARPPAVRPAPRATDTRRVAPRPERASPRRTTAPRSVSPTRRATPRAVAPRPTAPRAVAPRAVTPRPAPRTTAPRAVTSRPAPRAVAPRPAPRAVAPRAVSPRPAPRAAPRAVTPRTAPRAAPRAVAPRPTPRAAPRAVAPRPAPRVRPPRPGRPRRAVAPRPRPRPATPPSGAPRRALMPDLAVGLGAAGAKLRVAALMARPGGRVGSFAGAKLLRRRLLARPGGRVGSFAGAKLLRRTWRFSLAWTPAGHGPLERL